MTNDDATTSKLLSANVSAWASMVCLGVRIGGGKMLHHAGRGVDRGDFAASGKRGCRQRASSGTEIQEAAARRRIDRHHDGRAERGEEGNDFVIVGRDAIEQLPR